MGMLKDEGYWAGQMERGEGFRKLLEKEGRAQQWFLHPFSYSSKAVSC